MKKQKPNFEEALNAASLWCTAWQKEELSDEILADRVGELLETKNGARAFLAISLSSNSALMDRIPETLLFQLRSAGDLVVDLAVKNLAMSTAMCVHHKKNNDLDLKESSGRIKQRCIDLLRNLEPNLVKERLETLLDAIQGNGKDIQFLNQWGYDNDQKKSIAESIYAVADK